jgi:lipopolysaccharide transport system permease protein
MTKRDLVERQAGVALPGFWVLGQPLLMMLVSVFVFSFVFNTRLGGNESRFGYTIFLLAGLVPWLSFQEAIGRAPTSIIDNAALIKQIVFPIEIIPLKLALSTVLLLAVGLLVILLLSLAAGTSHTLWWLLLPLPIFCHLTMTIGLVYFLGAAGVFIRDFRNLVQLFLMIGVFVHPILYVPGMLPRWGEFIFALSPFSYVIWLYRDVLLGSVEHPVA